MKKNISLILAVLTLLICSSFTININSPQVPDDWESFILSSGETCWYGDFINLKTNDKTPVYLHYGDTEPAFYADSITYSFNSKIGDYFVCTWELPEGYAPCQFYINEKDLMEL